jgi:hypothetical protein
MPPEIEFLHRLHVLLLIATSNLQEPAPLPIREGVFPLSVIFSHPFLKLTS